LSGYSETVLTDRSGGLQLDVGLWIDQ